MELDGKSIYKATLWRFKCKELTSLTIAPGVVAVVSIRGAAQDDVLSEATAQVLEQEPVVVDGPTFENKAPDIGSRPSCVWEQAELSGNDCHLHCLSVPLHEIHHRW